MAKLELKGCGTALITPFRDGAVDYEAFRSLVKRQIKCGIDFLVPLGTTGETPCLSLEDALHLFVELGELLLFACDATFNEFSACHDVVLLSNLGLA